MSEVKFKNEIEEFVNELNTSLKKFRAATNSEMTPYILKSEHSILEMNRAGFWDYTKEDFLNLTDTFCLTIEEWRKPRGKELDNFIAYKSDKLRSFGQGNI